MKQTCWVVEQGEYSDYRVVGVFTSKANAQAVAGAINRAGGSEEATVDEWPIDPAVDDINAGRQLWLVNMRRDGIVERCEPWEVSGCEISGSMDMWRRASAPANIGQGIEDCLHATIWAIDAEHAIKIVNERRAHLIASGEWDRRQ